MPNRSAGLRAIRCVTQSTSGRSPRSWRWQPPVAAGRGTGDHFFDIVPGKPDDSILPYRMLSSEPGVMMPEQGRTTTHREGVALIRDWISAMSGACDAGAIT